MMAVALVSASAIAFEVLLTRFFAVANWEEYGYWVISMAMTGYAFSGVGLCLFKDFFAKRKDLLLFSIPLALLFCASGGFYLACLNPFNPLEIQNELLIRTQLSNIAGYYASLFPFFFLAGIYTGLNFIVFQREIAPLYGADLAGAGMGAAAILCLMYILHPFYLLTAILPFLAAACLLNIPKSIQSKKTAALLIVMTLLVYLQVSAKAISAEQTTQVNRKTIIFFIFLFIVSFLFLCFSGFL